MLSCSCLATSMWKLGVTAASLFEVFTFTAQDSFSLNASFGAVLICTTLFHREIQAQEALQNGQLGSGEGIPDLQPGVLASQAMIEKTLIEDPRWQGEAH